MLRLQCVTDVPADMVDLVEEMRANVIDVAAQQEDELIERYGMQLAMYRQAIEKLLSLPVKECLVYSFCLGKQIEVKTQQNVF